MRKGTASSTAPQRERKQPERKDANEWLEEAEERVSNFLTRRESAERLSYRPPVRKRCKRDE